MNEVFKTIHQVAQFTTISENGNWTSSVFVIKDGATFYLLSDSNSQHTRDLWMNSHALLVTTSGDVSFSGLAYVIEKEDEKKYQKIISQLKNYYKEDTSFIDNSLNLEWRLIQFIPQNISQEKPITHCISN